MEKILVVDDDLNICELLRLCLSKAGYEVSMAHNGVRAIEALQYFSPDLVILDIMMPGKDGLSVAKSIRLVSQDIAIMMLTAKGEVEDKVTAFTYGADDYMVKPFDTKELVARVKALLRRAQTKKEPKTTLEFDNLIIDIANYSITAAGVKTELPPKEIELLFHLASNPNTVYTRDQLLDEVWGYEYFGDSRTVDVHIKRLRDKLDNLSSEWQIKTVWGVGYKFELTPKL